MPLGAPARENTWVWVDLLTDNTDRARRFYGAVAGFETRQVNGTGGDTYSVFTHGEEMRGGLVRVRRSQVDPNWLPYVLVGDLDAAIAKATGLGASVLIREGGIAVLLDPSGAAIGVATQEGVVQ